MKKETHVRIIEKKPNTAEAGDAMDNELAMKRAMEYMAEIDEKYIPEILGILYAYKRKSKPK